MQGARTPRRAPPRTKPDRSRSWRKVTRETPSGTTSRRLNCMFGATSSDTMWKRASAMSAWNRASALFVQVSAVSRPAPHQSAVPDVRHARQAGTRRRCAAAVGRASAKRTAPGSRPAPAAGPPVGRPSRHRCSAEARQGGLAAVLAGRRPRRRVSTRRRDGSGDEGRRICCSLPAVSKLRRVPV